MESGFNSIKVMSFLPSNIQRNFFNHQSNLSDPHLFQKNHLTTRNLVNLSKGVRQWLPYPGKIFQCSGIVVVVTR